MAEAPKAKEEPRALSERVERYRQEVQFLIKQGGEQPHFEFKRTVSLAKENRQDRLDFIKLIQSVANAEITAERCVIIGADPRERKFFPLTNLPEFDAANISKILATCLTPLPAFEVFHLTTDDGEQFALVVLAANQPRPILVTKEGEVLGKVRLQVGDVWIKKNTDTVRASRADLDLMYRARVEEEAEDRARQRFKHFSELSPSQPIHSSGKRLPVRGLLVGPESELRTFGEELISDGDLQRFRMLLELARESLVEGWDRVGARGPGLPSDIEQFNAQLNDFFRDEFVPSLQSIVALGLLTIKYRCEFSWLDGLVDLLIESFDASRGLQRLKSGQVIQEGSLAWWRPAFEIYLGLRVIATYAISRNRLEFLKCLLPRYVTRLTVDDISKTETPVLFWPIPNVFQAGELRAGRSSYFWNERISAVWGKRFGNFERFLSAALQLEFLLEFNSYIGTNAPGDSKIRRWLMLNGKDRQFGYVPDLYAYDLQGTVPMAEHMFDLIVLQQGSLPFHLAIEPRLLQAALESTPSRMTFYGGFLHHLKTWQAKVMLQEMRFPFMFDWEGCLKEAVDDFKKEKVLKEQSNKKP
jgi:hypothetical protein